MPFDATLYGAEVAAILALDGGGERLLPLAGGSCAQPARQRLGRITAAQLFPAARAPEAALSGLYLYFSCLEEAHRIAQDIPSREGSYWHGIMHRQEPDADNAAYWFRRVGAHPVFPDLRREADGILAAAGLHVLPGEAWDPFAFIDLCEKARREAGSKLERTAREIQHAEWQLLFDYCACRAG